MLFGLGLNAVDRHDYAFPFRIDPGSGQARRASYNEHVKQMVRQVLLTGPGERACLPEFGCGLRQVLFAPNADVIQEQGDTVMPTNPVHATTQLMVRQALDRWLAGQVKVNGVRVTRDPDAGSVTIDVDYVVVDTLAADRTQVRLV